MKVFFPSKGQFRWRWCISTQITSGTVLCRETGPAAPRRQKKACTKLCSSNARVHTADTNLPRFALPLFWIQVVSARSFLGGGRFLPPDLGGVPARTCYGGPWGGRWAGAMQGGERSPRSQRRPGSRAAPAPFVCFSPNFPHRFVEPRRATASSCGGGREVWLEITKPAPPGCGRPPCPQGRERDHSTGRRDTPKGPAGEPRCPPRGGGGGGGGRRGPEAAGAAADSISRHARRRAHARPATAPGAHAPPSPPPALSPAARGGAAVTPWRPLRSHGHGLAGPPLPPPPPPCHRHRRRRPPRSRSVSWSRRSCPGWWRASTGGCARSTGKVTAGEGDAPPPSAPPRPGRPAPLAAGAGPGDWGRWGMGGRCGGEPPCRGGRRGGAPAGVLGADRGVPPRAERSGGRWGGPVPS